MEKMLLLHSVSIYCMATTKSWEKRTALWDGWDQEDNIIELMQIYNYTIVPITIFALFRKIVQTGVVPYSEIAHFSGFLSRGTTK